MNPILAGAAALVLAAGAATSQQVSEGQAPRIDAAGDARVLINELNTDDYPEVRVIATVLAGGEPVTGLTAEDFRVREEEIDQSPLMVEPQLPPLSVVVAIDTSGSMSDRMAETREAAKTFVSSLGDEDSVQLLRFARDIETLTPMVTTKAEVAAAIDTLNARGDTALYDAVVTSLDLLEDRRGRKAVVVLSDGVDDDGTGNPLSEATIDDVLARAREVNVPVYAIGLGTEMDEAVLTAIAEETGAVYLNAPGTEELAAVYATISDQLSGQYSIRYTSSLPADGTERRVVLEAPGGRDSRVYTGPGEAAAAVAAPAPPPSGECAPLAALEEVRGDLEAAEQRYQQDLIDITARNDVRRRATDALVEPFGQPASYACAVETFEEVMVLYDADAIDITQRNTLRDALATAVGRACSAEQTIEAVTACFELIGDAYSRDLIDISTRNLMREDAAEPLVEEVIAMNDIDAALVRINDLYDRDLIDITMRNDLRERALAAE